MTLQAVDKVGVPIPETQVSRDTTVVKILYLVFSKVQERHANTLNTPVSNYVGDDAICKHRTYTVLTDVSICKIATNNDAYSDELRELLFGERLDGYKKKE